MKRKEKAYSPTPMTLPANAKPYYQTVNIVAALEGETDFSLPASNSCIILPFMGSGLSHCLPPLIKNKNRQEQAQLLPSCFPMAGTVPSISHPAQEGRRGGGGGLGSPHPHTPPFTPPFCPSFCILCGSGSGWSGSGRFAVQAGGTQAAALPPSLHHACKYVAVSLLWLMLTLCPPTSPSMPPLTCLFCALLACLPHACSCILTCPSPTLIETLHTHGTDKRVEKVGREEGWADKTDRLVPYAFSANTFFSLRQTFLTALSVTVTVADRDMPRRQWRRGQMKLA